MHNSCRYDTTWVLLNNIKEEQVNELTILWMLRVPVKGLLVDTSFDDLSDFEKAALHQGATDRIEQLVTWLNMVTNHVLNLFG